MSDPEYSLKGGVNKMAEQPRMPGEASNSTERRLQPESAATRLYQALSIRLLNEGTPVDDWISLTLEGSRGRYTIGDQPSKTWMVTASMYGRPVNSIPGLEHVPERPHTEDIPAVVAAMKAMRALDPDQPIPLGVQVNILQSPDPLTVPTRSISLDINPFAGASDVEVSSYMDEADTHVALEAIAADLDL